MPFPLLSPYGPRYEINQLLYVGRDHACAIRPPDNLVSRVHACLWLDQGVVRVRDEGSSNGTFVNGTRLQPGQARALTPGDQVQFGETLFSLQGTPRAADFETLVEPPVVGTEPAAYAAAPADLGVLAPWLVEPRYVAAGAFGLFVHAALFFGGWWQVYNLADRGCALHIVLAICESPERALSAPEIEARYGAGRGLHWMPDKRIDDILDHGLATLRGGRLHATPKGARVARLFGLLRAVLRLDDTK